MNDPAAKRSRAAEAFSGEQVRLVELDQDHPGFSDHVYRRRRNDIAALAYGYRSDGPLPSVDYHPVEHAVWRTVWDKLGSLHEARACRAYLEGTARFDFPRDRIPSFAEVNAALSELEGFHLAPVAGLVMPVTFLEQLANRRFLATQYMRHHSQPLYTPEPDVVHEYIGHVGALSQPELAELNVAFGEATRRASTHADQAAGQAAVERLIRVYWYTLEFGLLVEDGDTKVYGAGILSSFGELASFESRADLRPWDLDAIAHVDYDPTDYQRVLFVAPSFGRMRDDLLRWLDTHDRA
jgi:phenylalanine-4-hydroxylase